jgi:hypothetical protein
MPPKKQKRGSRSRARCRPAYVCPNPLCQEVLPSQSGLTNHFLHFTTCSQVNTSVLSILETAHQAGIDRGTSTDTVAVDIDPCTHSDSDDEAKALFNFDADYLENEAEIGVADMAAEDNAALVVDGLFGMPVVARQAGVAHTVEDHAEIKLLKILEDAKVPHYLFKDILEWATEAKARG